MGEVVKLQQTNDEDLTKRFRSWWAKQDEQTRAAIREVVNADAPKAGKEQAVEVLNFLNLKTGKHYRATPPNLDMIKARLKTATVGELKAVIVTKCRDWAGDEKMERYLRPATLFSARNFEQYIGELGE